MFVRFTHTAVAPLWLVVFASIALLWSPMTVPIGSLLLLIALAGPAAALFLWNRR